MPHLAFATYAAVPALQPDDERLAAALARRGGGVTAAAWNDPAVTWDAFDAVVLRSTWDYYLDPAGFRAWLDAREAAGTPVLNPPPVVRWNLDKRYLRDLAGRGVAVVPTRWVEPGEPADLAALLAETGWDAVVVKPAVSAAAHETWRTARASAAADDARFRALAAGTVLVQPYLPEIEREGEWSLLFFGGAFSHAVRKRPRAGDFRVQPQHGGVTTLETPPAALREAAERVLAAAGEATGCGAAALAYARVDGCVVDGAFRLMELEVIEPTLFFTQAPEAAERAAAALLAAIGVGAPACDG
ncbi:MAG TPA: hypothetical protein VFS40_12750 [Gemmatimonadales bacterium]|nr:hypothetical protein [Gemmatimonadales bacterium]